MTATLYIDSSKIKDLTDYLASNRVTVVPYNQIDEDLVKANADKKRIGVHKATCNAELHRLVADACVNMEKNEIQHLKAVKNPVEQ